MTCAVYCNDTLNSPVLFNMNIKDNSLAGIHWHYLSLVCWHANYLHDLILPYSIQQISLFLFLPQSLFCGNNTACEAWTTKGSQCSAVGGALDHLQCALMLHNPVGICMHHISTKEHLFKDNTSHTPWGWYPSTFHPYLPRASNAGCLSATHWVHFMLYGDNTTELSCTHPIRGSYSLILRKKLYEMVQMHWPWWPMSWGPHSADTVL